MTPGSQQVGCGEVRTTAGCSPGATCVCLEDGGGRPPTQGQVPSTARRVPGGRWEWAGGTWWSPQGPAPGTSGVVSGAGGTTLCLGPWAQAVTGLGEGTELGGCSSWKIPVDLPN